MFPFIDRYKQDMQYARRRLQEGSQLRRTDAGLVELARIGEGPVILIAHGGGGGYDMSLWLARLIGGPFHFVAPSRFGYLRSPMPLNSTPEAQADTYAALLDALEIDDVAMIGLSAGGPSALQFALRYPGRCRGLLMISAISCSLPPLPFFA